MSHSAARKSAYAIPLIGSLLLIAGFSTITHGKGEGVKGSAAMLADTSGGENWAGYGGTYGEQHYSRLTALDSDNISRLGLAWSMDLGTGTSATQPLAIGGTLYFTTGLNIIHAVNAVTGKLLWEYDPNVAEVAGERLRPNWGGRGIGYWNGKVYVATVDGRLIALDAQTGKPVWNVTTVEPGDLRYITGAPRLFDGKVIIGNGGADAASVRGYVTTFDAETGKQLWRFYTVPGNPADGFKDEAMAMAAKTWAGEWWKYGGGGTVWNSITYDASTDTILLGTGNGAPWNRRVRSADKGDNLFLCSIVALDAKTGKYKWHYQINPGETWDYNANMDIHLADLVINGQPRKVAMTAPKNGFFYVIDRTDGKLISAEKIAKVTWADAIDVKTGRPVETPNARYPDGKTFELWPSNQGAHNWMPSAYSAQTKLAYIPVNQMGDKYSDVGITAANWHRTPHNAFDGAVNLSFDVDNPEHGTSFLLAWNPATQKPAWKIPTPNIWNGGVLATAGNLVFQGQIDGKFNAYTADSGKLLWSFPAQAAIVAAPITYSVGGRQYVTVLVGMGGSGGGFGKLHGRTIDYNTQSRRVLTFALDDKGRLPAPAVVSIEPAVDASFVPNPTLIARGAEVYGRQCISCHGLDVVAGGSAPDLRASLVPQSEEAFSSVVLDGALLKNGMPRFVEFDHSRLEAVRQFIRSEAAKARTSKSS